MPFRLGEVVGIHHLAWEDNLDARAIVLVQRHEDWAVATANSSIDPSMTNLDSYITGYECLRIPPGVDPRVNRQYRRSNTSMRAQGQAGRSVLEKQAVVERSID